MNKTLSIFQKLCVCNATHHKSFGLVSTAANEICNSVVFFIGNILFLIPMLIKYNVGGDEIPYPVKFPDS